MWGFICSYERGFKCGYECEVFKWGDICYVFNSETVGGVLIVEVCVGFLYADWFLFVRF